MEPAHSASFVWPGLVLLGLAVAAAFLSRRRARVSRLVQVVETVSLGPRRSLVLATLHGESLLIGVSEGGVTLLLTRPAAPAALQVADAQAAGLQPPPPPAPAPAPEPEPGPSIAARLRTAAEQTFAEVLATSAEDLELRRKLAGRTAR